MSLGSAEKTVPWVWYRKASGAGFSKLATVRSADVRRSRTAPAPPVRRVTGTGLWRAEQQVLPVIVAEPPLNGKSEPLPWSLTTLATPRSSMMSPAATIVQVVAGSKAAAPSELVSSALSGQSDALVTRSTPNRLLAPQARARTAGVTWSARRNASRFRCLARSLASVGASLARISRLAVAGRRGAERGEDRVGVVGDELEGVVAARARVERRRDVGRLDRASVDRKSTTGTIGTARPPRRSDATRRGLTTRRDRPARPTERAIRPPTSTPRRPIRSAPARRSAPSSGRPAG